MLDKEIIRLFTEKTVTHLLTAEELTLLTGLGKKRLTQNIDKINAEFLLSSQETVGLDNFDLNKIDIENLLLDFSSSYVLLDDYRKMLLYLIVYIQKESYSILELQDALDVSRNTVIADIKKLNNDLESVKVEYYRKDGYVLVGDELSIRKYALHYIFVLYKELDLKKILLDKIGITQEEFQYWLVETHSVLKEKKVNVMTGQISEIIIFILATHLRVKTLKNDELIAIHTHYMPNKKYLEFSKMYAPLFENNQELNYVSLLFASISQEQMVENKNNFDVVFNEFIKMFNIISGIDLFKNKMIMTRLKNHSISMLYREKYFYFLENELIKKIAEENESLNNVIKEALLPVEMELGKEISQTEIGYLVAIIESYLQKQKEPYRILKAIILCPNGTTSSVLLKNELEEMFPSIQFSKASSLSNFKDINPNDYDIIFSTIPVHTQKTVYIISNFLSNFEKQKLKKEIIGRYNLPTLKIPSYKEVEAIIDEYLEASDSIEQVYLELVRIITRDTKDQEEWSPVLKELLTEETIKINVEASDWEDAVRKSGEILVDTGSIEESYVEAMVNSVKKYGSYIVITPHIALAHASSTDGVNKVGFSLITLKNEIKFNHEANDPVKVVITLAATDQSTHLKALSELMELLGNEDFLKVAYDEGITKKDMLHLITKL
ncbi:BglG family transcription antiterminator [Vagococcus silagei]|uniref:PRD domain-containing protein n=1 Tax=Vagococcus silagei TaxID=2508885 RepID=A0A4S3B1M3_9ENTE|nr:PRD domain-containing protein [Vagococcus silagei]